MRALAGFIMRGRSQAVMVVAVCTVLSLIVAPLSYLGAGAVGLVALRHGPREGVVVMAGAGLAAALLSWFLVGTPLPVLALVLMLWLPVWLLSLLLRQTASQGIVLAAAGLLGLLALLGVHLVLASPEAWWRALLEETLVPMLEQRDVSVEPGAVAGAARLMTGLVVAVTLLGVLASVYLGRWWQALLYNPGGFATEFRALRLDRRVAIGTVVVLLIVPLAGDALGTLGNELVTLAVALYMVQGLAVVHALVASRGASVAWLVVLYLGLILLWPVNIYVMLTLAAGGLVDALVDLRTRFGGA